MHRNRNWLVLLVFSALGAASIEPSAELMLPGENWERNVQTQSGDSWLALRNDSGISSLTTAKVIVSKNPREGMRPIVLTIEEGFSPVFLVRGIAGLQPGAARTLFDGELSLGMYQGVHFHDLGPSQKWMTLSAVPGEIKTLPHNKRSERGYQLVLTDIQARVKQCLLIIPSKPVNTPGLRWAGDLDRDGRIDLLLDVETGEAAGSTYQLWLSTLAKRGELVGLAATLRDPAC